MLRQPLTITVLLALAFGLAFAFLAVRGWGDDARSSGATRGATPVRAKAKLQ